MNNKWKSKMDYELLQIALYAIKCVDIIDDSNYYDVMRSIERKARNFRTPK
jgi:hypothetical protein